MWIRSVGEQVYQWFEQERLHTDEAKSKFHDNLPNVKPKSFADMNENVMTSAIGLDISLYSDRNLFAQIILIAQSRMLDLKTALAHLLEPMPWSTSTPVG